MQTPGSTDHQTEGRVKTKTSAVLARLASSLGRRDDVPNQELARDPAKSRDTDAIAELVANLDHPKQQVRSGLDHLWHCRPKDVPQRAEAILEAVDSRCKEAFVAVIRARMGGMRPAQERRLKKVIAAAEKR